MLTEGIGILTNSGKDDAELLGNFHLSDCFVERGMSDSYEAYHERAQA